MNTRLLFTAGATMLLATGCLTTLDEPAPASTPDRPGQPPTDTPTPTRPVILTEAGVRIEYTGPLEVQAGGTLEVTFQVFGPDSQPAQGTFFASLGDPPTDARASHANGPLDQEGKITLRLPVNWPAGVTKLHCGFQDQVHEVAEVVIGP